MKIIDGLDISGVKTIIPDTDRDDLPQFFVDMGFKKGVEIGVWKGKYTVKLLEAGLQVYGVDPFEWYDDCKNYGKQENLDKVLKRTQKKLSKYPNYTFIRKRSMEALEDFDDESIDFVYIDGNHGFMYVAEDIHQWSKKVRKGGVISGHDYITLGPPGYSDVKHVIDAYTGRHRMKWYVLGRKHPRKGEKRDKERSWFWFKT